MNPQDYQCAITAPLPPAEALEKISQVGEWWAVNFKGNAQNLHDRFTVHFARTTWSLMEIVETIPDRRIVWEVVDCHLPIFKDPTLWKGHRIAWEITREGLLTRVSMTHLGLAPGVECYEDCRKGWNFYVGESLLKLFTEGRGLPGSGIFADIYAGEGKYEGLLFSRSEAFPDFADGYVLIDVRENSGERVVSVHSVSLLDRSRMSPNDLQGDYYMILENRSIQGKITPLEDLQAIAPVSRPA